MRHERKYTTSPTQLPTLIFPNLAPENVFKAKSYGKISCIECNLQVRESIIGYKDQPKLLFPIQLIYLTQKHQGFTLISKGFLEAILQQESFLHIQY